MYALICSIGPMVGVEKGAWSDTTGKHGIEM